MANWAWPHTPPDNMARILLRGGPFDGEEAGFVPPDIAAPVQVAWGGWMPWGFDAWIYEWNGECTTDRGRTDALIYRPSGRRLRPDEVPPAIGELTETWADGADLIAQAFGLPPEAVWPGI